MVGVLHTGLAILALLCCVASASDCMCRCELCTMNTATECNGTININVDYSRSPGTEVGVGGVVATVFLLIGLAVGIACSVAVFKFMRWMEGKSVVFTPWPKIRSSSVGTDDTTLHNPTYGIGSTSAANRSGGKSPAHPSGSLQPQFDLYEEPADAESNFACLEPVLEPYAIHDFSEEVESKSARLASTRGAPKVTAKTHLGFTGRNKTSKDKHRSMSESESGNIRSKVTEKPPIAKKINIPVKPGKNRTNSQAGVLDRPKARALDRPQAGALEPPHAAYSELNQKTSYATLEPHMGDKLEDMSFNHASKENYSHLNR